MPKPWGGGGGESQDSSHKTRRHGEGAGAGFKPSSSDTGQEAAMPPATLEGRAPGSQPQLGQPCTASWLAKPLQGILDPPHPPKTSAPLTHGNHSKAESTMRGDGRTPDPPPPSECVEPRCPGRERKNNTLKYSFINSNISGGWRGENTHGHTHRDRKGLWHFSSWKDRNRELRKSFRRGGKEKSSVSNIDSYLAHNSERIVGGGPFSTAAGTGRVPAFCLQRNLPLSHAGVLASLFRQQNWPG